MASFIGFTGILIPKAFVFCKSKGNPAFGHVRIISFIYEPINNLSIICPAWDNNGYIDKLAPNLPLRLFFLIEVRV